jgi:hypothetical protein
VAVKKPEMSWKGNEAASQRVNEEAGAGGATGARGRGTARAPHGGKGARSDADGGGLPWGS